MCAAAHLTAGQFSRLAPFIRRGDPDGIVPGHHRRPLDIAQRIALGVLQLIAPIDEPIIRDGPLAADLLRGPGDAFAGQHGIAGRGDAGNAQRIIEGHGTARGVHLGHLAVPHPHPEGIRSADRRGIGVRGAQAVRGRRDQCAVRVIHLIGIPHGRQAARGFRGQGDGAAKAHHICICGHGNDFQRMDGDGHLSPGLRGGALRAVPHGHFDGIDARVLRRVREGGLRFKAPEVQLLPVLIQREGIGIVPVAALRGHRPGDGIIRHIRLGGCRDLGDGHGPQAHDNSRRRGRGVPHGIRRRHGQRVGARLKRGIRIAGLLRRFPAVDHGIALFQRIGIGIRVLSAGRLGIPGDGVLGLRLRHVRVEAFQPQLLQQHREGLRGVCGAVVVRVQHVHLQGVIPRLVRVRGEHIVFAVALGFRLPAVNEQLEAVPVGLHAAFRRRRPGDGVIQVRALLVRRRRYLQAALRLRHHEIRACINIRKRIIIVPHPHGHVIGAGFSECISIRVLCAVAGLLDPGGIFIQRKLVFVRLRAVLGRRRPVARLPDRVALLVHFKACDHQLQLDILVLHRPGKCVRAGIGRHGHLVRPVKRVLRDEGQRIRQVDLRQRTARERPCADLLYLVRQHHLADGAVPVKGLLLNDLQCRGQGEHVPRRQRGHAPVRKQHHDHQCHCQYLPQRLHRSSSLIC